MAEADDQWEEQEMEMETLKCIFSEEELSIKKEKPYQLEVLLNSNTESEERNYLKLRVIYDLPEAYPNEVPFFRLKNLSPDYLDNNALEMFESDMRAQAEESIGQMMLFELTDLLKDKITEINEKVLKKLDKIEEASSIANLNKEVMQSDMTQLSYTPVNAETFAVWCAQYKEKIRIVKEATKTINDDKPTGKQLFLDNRSTFDEITLEADEEEEELVEETVAAADDEEAKAEESDEDKEFVYDAALYDADGLDDEDVDFDDWIIDTLRVSGDPYTLLTLQK